MTIISAYRDGLATLSLSHIWRGYGSAVCFEFGRLTPSEGLRGDGSPGNPIGQFSLLIEWGWRIEGQKTIICGSSQNECNWPAVFATLLGRRVLEVGLFGRLPEISVGLTGERWITSLMTASENDGQPAWALIERVDGIAQRAVSARDGQVYEESFKPALNEQRPEPKALS